ncbi:MAG: type II and III secretion system protein family protein [Caulobacteraceae bacterium]
MKAGGLTDMMRNSTSSKKGPAAPALLAAALFLAAGAAIAPQALAQGAAPQAPAMPKPTEVTIAAGKSQVVQFGDDYTDIMVADPKIADVLPLNSRSIYVVGKGAGSTALSVYGPKKQLMAAVTVTVSADLDGLKARLHEILPREGEIAIRPANQSIVLSGAVSSPEAMRQVLTLAESYAPGKVVNMLYVQGVQQVMLSVRFVEMSRSTAKDLHLNLASADVPAKGSGFTFVTGDDVTRAAGGGTSFSAAKASSFGYLFSKIATGNGDLGLMFDALETKGLVKTLAEPNLVAMSGDTANFLAGGEFPIPIASASATGSGGVPTLTVEFKQYGVGLAFTPTIRQDGLINLVVNPEVSAIDASTSINTGIVSVPGLKVRRAHTTVELRDGESFTIAGLLKDDYQNDIRQFPWLGEVPVLGMLFRSTDFQRSETELVIVVTPHLVVPRKGPAATPLDHFVPPSDIELFLIGQQRGSGEYLSPEDKALISADPKGGVDGPHGHVLY